MYCKVTQNKMYNVASGQVTVTEGRTINGAPHIKVVQVKSLIKQMPTLGAASKSKMSKASNCKDTKEFIEMRLSLALQIHSSKALGSHIWLLFCDSIGKTCQTLVFPLQLAFYRINKTNDH